MDKDKYSGLIHNALLLVERNDRMPIETRTQMPTPLATLQNRMELTSMVECLANALKEVIDDV
jgi:hypothetical protein